MSQLRRAGIMALAFFALTFGAAVNAKADVITFTTFGDLQSAANAAGASLENVLSPGDATGTTVTGITNLSNTLVDVSSTHSLSISTANGQARFSANPNGSSFSDFTIELQNGGSFRALGLNLNELGNVCTKDNPCTLTFNIVGNVNPGEETQTFDFTGGSGFLGFLAVEGQSFSSVSLTSGVNLTDISQVRLGGFEPAAVPEPTTMFLLGTGLVGVAARARRRRKAGKGAAPLSEV